MILTPPTGMLSRSDAIQAALARMQPAGSGFNTSLMSVANGMYYAAILEAEGLELARGGAASLGVPESRFWEIERAFGKAYRGNSALSGGTSHRGGGSDHAGAIAELKRVPRDVERVEALSEVGLKEKLSASSPGGLPSDAWPTVRAIYPDRKTLLCVGMAQDDGRVVLRDSCLELSRCSFIVPNPMTGYVGRNQDGELSCRTLDNTGPRRFLIIECDFSRYDRTGLIKTIWYDVIERLSARGITTSDMCAGAILELARLGLPAGVRLVMVVSSGGKSLHAWFSITGYTEAEVFKFFKAAMPLGADPVTWVPCQWVRMPNGIRNDDGVLRRQPVIYFDPGAVGNNL